MCENCRDWHNESMNNRAKSIPDRAIALCREGFTIEEISNTLNVGAVYLLKLFGVM